MKAIFAIVDYSLGPKLNLIFQKEMIPLKLVTHGHGSADSELLELLGLGENKKMVMISIVKTEKIPSLYKRLDREMKLSRTGTGVAFSVPLKSISTVITKLYQIETKELAKEKEKDMANETPFELILTIVNRGHFDVVKEAAKSAGARGGTLIHGLGIGGEEGAKFLGINIQPEKDIIMIVVKAEDKQTVMKRIIEDAGILKDSRGICFSIPVDSAFGLAENIIDEE